MVRQLAFGALRELFAPLSKKQHVVLFVDDVQWGDTDSAALLVELMRPPEAPPILLLTTHRTEEEETSPFLADMRARWPEDAEARELTVGPLTPDDARQLALSLLGIRRRLGAADRRRRSRTSRRGSPFLLEELARGASAYHRIAMGDTLLAPPARSRSTRCSPRASRACRTTRDGSSSSIAIGGRPLPVATVGAAAQAGDSVTQLVAALRTRRFVRAGLRDGRRDCRGRATTASARRSSRSFPPAVARESHRSSRGCSRRRPTPTRRRSRRTCSARGDKERAARLRRARRRAGHREAGVRAGRAPVRARRSRRSGRVARGPPARAAHGGGLRVGGPRREGGARIPQGRGGRAGRSSGSTSSGSPRRSSSPPDASTRAPR